MPSVSAISVDTDWKQPPEVPITEKLAVTLSLFLSGAEDIYGDFRSGAKCSFFSVGISFSKKLRLQIPSSDYKHRIPDYRFRFHARRLVRPYDSFYRGTCPIHRSWVWSPSRSSQNCLRRRVFLDTYSAFLLAHLFLLLAQPYFSAFKAVALG